MVALKPLKRITPYELKTNSPITLFYQWEVGTKFVKNRF